jgi:hypothetical protein
MTLKRMRYNTQRQNGGEVLKKKWKNKAMHGQYIRNIDRQLASEELLQKGFTFTANYAKSRVKEVNCGN